jgi:hypothetical protein
MAEWVAFATLERLAVDTLERRRQAATATLRGHPTLLQQGLDLEAHGTPQGFTAWHLREGSAPVYPAGVSHHRLPDRASWDRSAAGLFRVVQAERRSPRKLRDRLRHDTRAVRGGRADPPEDASAL